ncbi:hypothetical protein DPSP01_003678 [Paraphaeosphaeria sporulosa]|uniref:BZIP domain-containing protein n=1 Tax=Paraphaeosphaeria sporulosa TaxID=1460663 RepID=A0A177CQR7_9PLEO|nr:uncharacterized protein CC84DRAFT_455647 [Paraphaeosphaeria sporulosa]OAG09863.1 hypothetical protein CC84DRAFT_455647 [Paraphaeosphaeria sporulosa]
MTDPKKAQNLARIRDNQRRSRARRKEYLHELEARLRDYEQVGIEASAEIQSAARKVLDENRRLRALLHDRGIPDSDIVAAMGGLNDRSYDQISSSASLSATLEKKITCNTTAFLTSPVSPYPSDARNGPHTSTVAPLALPMPRSAALSSNDSPSPHSIISDMGTPPPSFHGTPYMHTLTPDPGAKPGDLPLYMPYDPSIQHPWPQLHQHTHEHTHEEQYVANPTSYYNATSCIDAAKIIRTMRTGTGPELETDLSCRPGQHCYVGNSMVFNNLDRYGSPHGV